MKILFAADASPFVLQNAALLGRCLPSDRPIQVDLMTVVTPGAALPTEWRRDRLGVWGAASPWSEGVERILDRSGVTLRRSVLTGGAAEVLVRASGAYDLVVAGVKGEGAADFVQLGTVARALLRHAEASVLLVRGVRGDESLTAPGSGSSHPLRIVLPTDDSDEGIHDVLGKLWPIADAKVDFIPVTHPDSTDADRPAVEIGRRAQESQADLIILGARAGGPTPPAPLDTLDRELAWRAPCSILMLRRPAPTEAPRAQRVPLAPNRLRYVAPDKATPAWTTGPANRP